MNDGDFASQNWEQWASQRKAHYIQVPDLLWRVLFIITPPRAAFPPIPHVPVPLGFIMLSPRMESHDGQRC